MPDAATEELRELVRLRERLLQDFGDRVRQLHRLVDLGFPEFTRYVRTLDSVLATTILHDYPTAAAFRGVSVKRLAGLRYDGRHHVGLDLARALIEAAKHSVGQHHSAVYRTEVRYACQDLDLLRRRLRELDHDIDGPRPFFITLDIAIVSVLVATQPLFQSAADLPAVMIVPRVPMFPFYFVILGVAAFSFSPGMVLWTGIVGALGWLAAFLHAAGGIDGSLNWRAIPPQPDGGAR